MYCSETTLVNRDYDRVRAVTLYCRSWKCPICKPERVKRLINDAANGLPTKFLTLTTRRVPSTDPVAEARRQAEAFSALILWMRRSNPGEEVEFFAVREATKKGWPHIHVMLRAPFIHWKKLRKKWAQLSGSPGIDVRAIFHPTKCAKYLAKYLGKDNQQFGTCKRYWQSKRYALRGDEPPPEPDFWPKFWEQDERSVGVISVYYWRMGWITIKSVMRNACTCDYYEGRKPP